jgi:hypothetical protein
MRKITAVIITLLLLSGCTCLLKKTEVCNNETYGPVVIRLSDFKSQIIYYYRDKRQIVPLDFDGDQFTRILKQLPPDQVNQKDVDYMISNFKVAAHRVNGGFSVMLCKDSKKIMEAFANPKDAECRFDLTLVEIQSWNENMPCSFEVNWQQYCKKP